MYQRFEPLVTHLEKSLNTHIEFSIAKNYQNQIELLDINKVQIAILGPYNYVKAKKTNPNLTYIATRQRMVKNRLTSTYKGIIVASKNSHIKNLSQLKGSKFGFTDFNSTSGYLLPSIILKKNHINKSDFKQLYMLKKHSRVMEALSRDSIDAGATYYENYVNYVKKYGNIYKILYMSEEIPEEVIVTSSSISKAMIKKIEKAVLSYKKRVGDESIYNYIKIDEKKYDYIKKRMEFVQ